MEIYPLVTTNTDVPPTQCSVCDLEFQPNDDMDFVCKSCTSKLGNNCEFGYDDVIMDWGIETEGDLPYYWVISCVCGRELRSRLCSLNDMNAVAKELHAEWLKP